MVPYACNNYTCRGKHYTKSVCFARHKGKTPLDKQANIS